MDSSTSPGLARAMRDDRMRLLAFISPSYGDKDTAGEECWPSGLKSSVKLITSEPSILIEKICLGEGTELGDKGCKQDPASIGRPYRITCKSEPRLSTGLGRCRRRSSGRFDDPPLPVGTHRRCAGRPATTRALTLVFPARRQVDRIVSVGIHHPDVEGTAIRRLGQRHRRYADRPATTPDQSGC